jgi:hypothetical protein
VAKRELFRTEYDLAPELVVDFVQQAMTALPSITWHRVAEGGDRVDFNTSFTLTSWGEKMSARVEPIDAGGSALVVRGEPLVPLLSNPWGEGAHASTIRTQLLATIAGLVATAETNPLLMLQADHRRVEALFVRIAALAGEDRAGPVQELVDALRVHMELEETYVYPLVRRSVDGPLASEAEVDHELARAGLDQLLERSPDEPGFDGALAMVVAGVEHHVVEEETEVFPALARELGADGLSDLAQQLTTARAGLLAERSDTGRTRPTRRRPTRPDRKPAPRRTQRSRRAEGPNGTTRAALVGRAKEAGVHGYSHMTKAELAAALG